MTVRAVRNGGEPSEVRGARPVMIRDRNGADLPYSKGLMATSMMAAGLGPELAYRTAAQVQDRVRRMAAKRITTGVLCTVASQVLENEFGPDVAENYLAWRRVKRAPRPIVVLIGGATGVGKSTVATKLAARLDLPRVVATDAVREIMRSLLTASSHPEIFRSSFETEGSSPDAIPAFASQAETVATGIVGLIERSVVERRSLIVEGVHLMPGLLEHPRLRALSADALLIQVLLVVEDLQVHRAHFLTRLENEHGRRPDRYLAALEDIRSVQHYLTLQAERWSVPIVDASNLDEAIRRVLRQVVNSATSHAPNVVSIGAE